MILEMCIESVESAVASAEGGADRVELCANLLEGGTTPSLGSVRETRRRANIDLSVMVRPRGGDFCYSPEEFAVMREDVKVFREEGVDCLVFGLLNRDGTIDSERTAELIELAGPVPVTVHRAFDMCRDPFEGLETICSLGATRILTSGQEDTVLEGVDLIRDLVHRAGDRVVIMPGCGVTLKNCARIAAETGASEIHVAVVSAMESDMEFRNSRVYMGTALRSAEYAKMVTQPSQVAEFAKVLKA